MEHSTSRTWIVDDSTAPCFAVRVTIRHRSFHEHSVSTAWQVNTSLVSSTDSEVHHRNCSSLTTAVTDCSLNVGESNLTHCEITNVCVGVTWSSTTVAVCTVCVVVLVSRSCGDCSSTGVLEVNVTEYVSVIGSSSCGTIICEGETLPFCTSCTLEEDTVGGVSNSLD